MLNSDVIIGVKIKSYSLRNISEIPFEAIRLIFHITR